MVGGVGSGGIGSDEIYQNVDDEGQTLSDKAGDAVPEGGTEQASQALESIDVTLASEQPEVVIQTSEAETLSIPVAEGVQGAFEEAVPDLPPLTESTESSETPPAAITLEAVGVEGTVTIEAAETAADGGPGTEDGKVAEGEKNPGQVDIDLGPEIDLEAEGSVEMDSVSDALSDATGIPESEIEEDHLPGSVDQVTSSGDYQKSGIEALEEYVGEGEAADVDGRSGREDEKEVAEIVPGTSDQGDEAPPINEEKDTVEPMFPASASDGSGLTEGSIDVSLPPPEDQEGSADPVSEVAPGNIFQASTDHSAEMVGATSGEVRGFENDDGSASYGFDGDGSTGPTEIGDTIRGREELNLSEADLRQAAQEPINETSVAEKDDPGSESGGPAISPEQSNQVARAAAPQPGLATDATAEGEMSPGTKKAVGSPQNPGPGLDIVDEGGDDSPHQAAERGKPEADARDLALPEIPEANMENLPVDLSEPEDSLALGITEVETIEQSLADLEGELPQTSDSIQDEISQNMERIKDLERKMDKYKGFIDHYSYWIDRYQMIVDGTDDSSHIAYFPIILQGGEWNQTDGPVYVSSSDLNDIQAAIDILNGYISTLDSEITNIQNELESMPMYHDLGQIKDRKTNVRD